MLLTNEQTLTPVLAPMSPADARSPSDPAERDAMLAEGFGDLVTGPGEGYVTRTPDGSDPPAPGAAPKRLVRFVHMPDLQLADDESPTRLAAFDTAGLTAGAFRPQDAFECRILNAAVRTVNAVSKKDPFDFLLLGGDNADSSQQNEVDWVMAILDGASKVECDSGADDDPVPGPNNDGKDPFTAPGLTVPWYWVTGNHDILVQGNLPVTAEKDTEALGDNSVGGTRDWSQPGGPIFKGPVVPDPNRHLLDRKALMSRIAADGDGHGVGSAQMASGKAIYTFDVPDTPLRFLVLDTAAESGGSEGLIRQGDIDTVIKPLLDQAKTDGKIVSLASHHAVTSLGDGHGLGGSVQADAVTPDAWLDFIGGYDNVLLSFVGHSHENRVRVIGPQSGGHSWWEVMTSALADFPNQLRVIEIWDEDNGWLRVHATNLDWNDMGDKVAREGRKLGVLDYVSGWIPGEAPGTPEDRNVDLWIQKP